MTTGDPIRVVLVGAGGMGRVWLDLLANSPLVDLVGLVDLDLDAADRAVASAGLGGVSIGTSLTEVTEASEASAVVNVTVPTAHLPVNLEALFAGLPVLCEKPIAPTVSEAMRLAAASEVSGRLLMTSQSRRYYRALAAFKSRLGDLGDIGLVTTDFFLAPRFGGFRDAMAHPLLVDMAIHPFDVARYLLDEEPVSVYCDEFNPSWSWYDGAAATTAIFEMAGGARYVYTGSWCSEGLATSWNGQWRLSGSRGSAVWDGEGPASIELADGAMTEAVSDEADDAPEEIAGALEDFVRALQTDSVPASGVHSNLMSLAMVESAVRSAELGAKVLVAEVLRDALHAAIRDEPRPDVRGALERFIDWPALTAG